MPSPPPSPQVPGAVARARSRVGTGRYVTGAGGLDPHAAGPEATAGRRRGCDAAGFLAWCLGYPRHVIGFVDGWDWINADSMIVEAETRGTWFCSISSPEVGGVVAYPTIEPERDGHRERPGHAGLIVDVPATWSTSSWIGLHVVHCSPSLQRRLGHAIDETHGLAWAQRASFRGRTHPRWRTRFLRFVRVAP